MRLARRLVPKARTWRARPCGRGSVCVPRAEPHSEFVLWHFWEIPPLPGRTVEALISGQVRRAGGGEEAERVGAEAAESKQGLSPGSQGPVLCPAGWGSPVSTENVFSVWCEACSFPAL